MDKEVKAVGEKVRSDIKKFPYAIPEHKIENGITVLTNCKFADGNCELQIFGEHNLMNLNGARLVCNQIGVSDEQFYEAIQSFTGAAKRLEVIKKNAVTAMYKDFAHSHQS